MVWADAFEIGCGVATCREAALPMKTKFACAYRRNLHLGGKLYTKGPAC